MDYQCIVVYTIVRIAPLCSAQSTSTMCLSASCLCTSELAAAASAADRSEKGCLDWIKIHIKRYVKPLGTQAWVNCLHRLLCNGLPRVVGTRNVYVNGEHDVQLVCPLCNLVNCELRLKAIADRALGLEASHSACQT